MRLPFVAAHFFRAGALAALFTLRAAAQTTLVDDSFADGNRTGQTPPPSVAWFVNTGSGLTATTSVAGLQLNNTSSRLLVGYFTASGSPASVPVGQTITLEITFTSDVAPAAVTNGFNLALLNSGGSRIAADFSGTSNAAFSNYDGYGSKTGGLGSTSGSAITLRRRNAATRSTALMSTSGDWSTFATGTGTTPVAAANTAYVATLTIANNGGSAAINYTIKTANGASTLHSLSGSDTTASGVLGAFDAVALYAQTGEFPSGTVTLQRVRVLLSGTSVTPTAPVFTTQPASQSVNVGGNVTFSAAASGNPTPTYQWKKEGTDVTGATGTSLVLSNVQSADAGNYTVVATNSVTSVTSATATLTVVTVVVDPPIITASPVSQTVNVGDTATFTVTASGTAPLAYQWRKNGSSISGATNPTLTLTNVQSSAAGAYTVVVSNSAGSATSTAATLAVNTPPAITAQPLAAAVTVGSNASFSVVATGSPAPTYQWQKDGTSLPAATAATLTLTNVQFADAGSYVVVATNPLGSATSAAAALTVSAPSPLSRYSLRGFATVGAGTTGGGIIPETDPAYVKVTTPLELANALIAAAKTAGAVKVIEIMNDLNLGWNEVGSTVQSLASNPFRSHAAPKLHPVLIATGVSLIDIKPKSGLTIFSANGATIRHANFNIKGTSNIILRNLKFDEMWEWDEATKGDYDSNDWDFVTLSNGGAATNVWIDHCTFTKAYDGIVDMKAGTQNVTLSWCKYIGDDGATNANSFVRQQIAALEANRSSYTFYNFLRTNGFSVEDIVTIIQGHDKGHLMGSNSLDSENATLSATFHHQWFANLWDRCVPRLRAGNVHNYNIYVDDSSVLLAKRLRDARAAAMSTSVRNTLNNTYSFNPPINGSISTEGGALLLEKSVYLDCLWPLRNNQTDPTNPIYTGKIVALDTRYIFHNADGSIVNVRGNSTDSGSPLGPFQAAIIPFSWGGFSTLPYSYTPDDPDDLPQMLAIGAGAGALSWSKDNWLKTNYTDPAFAPEITQQPIDQTAIAGAPIAFVVTATGTAPLSYQWSKNGAPIVGQTASTLTLPSVTATDAADYSVTVTNLVGAVTSTVAHLTVLLPPTIAAAPQSQTVTVGDSVSFSVVATGTTPLAFQWGKNGVPLAGETSASLVLGVVTTAAAGSYAVTVSNVAGTVTSEAAVLTVNKAQATLALSGLDTIYDGTSKAIVASTVPTGLVVTVAYDGSSIPPTDAGTYTVTAVVVDRDYVGSATGSLSIARAPANIALSGLAQVYDGAPKTVSAATTPVGLPVALTYDGNAAAPIDAGSYAVRAVVDTRNYVGSSEGSLSIARATANIALTGLTQVYDGAPKPVSAATTPTGLPVVVTYDGSTTAPTDAGSYAVHAVVDTRNYVGSSEGSLSIARATANIALTGLMQVYDGNPKTVSAATTPIGLPVVVTYDGSTTAPIDAGSYAVRAVVDTHNYLGSALGTLQIARATAAIQLLPLQQRYDGTPRVVIATTTPAGLGVALSYDGGTVAPVFPGNYALTATIIDPNYVGSASVTQSVTATALTRHAPNLDGGVDGSVQLATGEDVSFAGVATLSGDLLVPGSPLVTQSGHATLVAVQDGPGSATPGNYAVALRGNALLRYVARQVDALALPIVALPAAPSGTRSVVLANARSTVGDWVTLRDATVNSGYGQLTLPPGSYGNFTINGATLVIGVAGAEEPSRYDLQSLTINGGQVVIVGPVVVTAANGVHNSGVVGAADRAAWLTLRASSGGVTLTGTGVIHGNIVAPTSTVVLDGATQANGTIVADRLTISSHAQLNDPRP